MNTHASAQHAPAARIARSRTSPASIALFVVLLLVGIVYSGASLRADVASAGPVATRKAWA